MVKIKRIEQIKIETQINIKCFRVCKAVKLGEYV